MKIKRYAEMSLSERKIDDRLVLHDGDGLRIQVRKKKRGQPNEIMIEMDVIGNYMALTHSLAVAMTSFIDGALDDDDRMTRCFMIRNAGEMAAMYSYRKLEEIEGGDHCGQDAES